MFPNLEAEQSRMGLNNSKVAEKLNISRVSFENKKKNGKFNRAEIVALCELFHSSFEYLFSENARYESAS